MEEIIVKKCKFLLTKSASFWSSPARWTLTDCVHDYRMQTIKDVPLARTTFLHLRKRRYRCKCGKRFFEKNTFLGRYQRATKQAIAAVPSGPWYCPTMAVSTME